MPAIKSNLTCIRSNSGRVPRRTCKWLHSASTVLPGYRIESQSVAAAAAVLPLLAAVRRIRRADALAGSGSADGSSPQQAALTQLEAGLERARQRGRPLVLVNSAACPNMSWEPSSSEWSWGCVLRFATCRQRNGYLPLG
jgi:hypothetical protein